MFPLCGDDAGKSGTAFLAEWKQRINSNFYVYTNNVPLDSPSCHRTGTLLPFCHR